MSDVFLSYSREDQSVARRFAEGLGREGFSVWWDQTLHSGDAYDKVTERALEEAKAVVVLWSRTSVDSRWVRAEATQADRNGTLVPADIEPCKRPIMFELTHTADLSGWKGDAQDPAWRAFVEDVRRFTGGHSPAATTAPHTTGRTASRTPLYWIAALALLAVAAGVYWLVRNHGDSKLAARTGQASVAVLPFDDMSPNKDQDYFADGIAEEILNQLASIDQKQLRVIARNSSFAVRGRSVVEVGQILDVEHVLEGSVRRDGDQLRITAQLINAKTDAHLWSKTYDRPLTGIFAVQEEIARSVADTLQVSLGIGFAQRPGMTRNVEAYDAALAASAQIPHFTPDTQRRAAELLQQAVAKDPGYARAWRQLADVYSAMPQYGIGNPQEWQRKSEEAFGQFERLLPEEAQMARLVRLGNASANAGRLREAGNYMRQAWDARAKLCACVPPTAPESPWFMLAVGRPRDAATEGEALRARNPLDIGAAVLLALAYSEAGDFKASRAEVERGEKLAGGHVMMRPAGVTTAMSARDTVQLRRWLELAAEVAADANVRDFDLRMAALLEQPKEALAFLEVTAKNSADNGSALSILMLHFAYFGDDAAALRILGQAFEKGAGWDTWTNTWYPVQSGMRRLPGFKQLVKDSGLVEYWKEYGWGDFCKPTTGDDFECH